jgi:hypothetical protein
MWKIELPLKWTRSTSSCPGRKGRKISEDRSNENLPSANQSTLTIIIEDYTAFARFKNINNNTNNGSETNKFRQSRIV